jgi:hypothetical protein
MSELNDLADYGVDRSGGNNLLSLRNTIFGSSIAGGGSMVAHDPKGLWAIPAIVGGHLAERYGPMTYAKSANALKSLPNPLSGATGDVIRSGIKAQPGVQLSPALIDYLKSMSQGGDQ